MCLQLWLFNGEDSDSPVDFSWIFHCFQFHFEVLHGKNHGKSMVNPLEIHFGGLRTSWACLNLPCIQSKTHGPSKTRAQCSRKRAGMPGIAKGTGENIKSRTFWWIMWKKISKTKKTMLYHYCILLLISKFCSCMLPCIVFGKRTGTMKSESNDARIRFQSEVAGDGSPSATDVHIIDNPRESCTSCSKHVVMGEGVSWQPLSH